jgi:hypothetical protein
MNIEKPATIDLLDMKSPALSATSDIPVIETKPDATPDSKPADKLVKPGANTDSTAAPEKGKTEDGKAAESAPAEEATTAESAASETEGEPKKPAKGVQKRLDELTRQREDERRAREAAEARLDRTLSALERLTGKPAQEAKEELEKADPEPARPERQQYPDTEAFTSALMDYAEQKASWTARREVKATIAENERKLAETRIAEEQQRTTTTYRERVEKAVEKYPDFHSVAESPDVAITIPMAQAIMHSEHGPEIQYYLGSNAEDAKRIAALSVPLQLIELGMIVAKLTHTPAKEAVADLKAEVKAAVAEDGPPLATTKPDNVSKAPLPPKALKGGGPQGEKPLAELSMDEYASRRRAEMSRRSAGHRVN